MGDVGRVALSWFGAGIPLALVTQLWAGSDYSPGQGGGFAELMGWVAGFGVLTLLVVAERHVHTRSDDLVDLARTGATLGFVAGAVVALVWFSSKAGPEAGDWFIGPACACAGVALVLYLGTLARRR